MDAIIRLLTTAVLCATFFFVLPTAAFAERHSGGGDLFAGTGNSSVKSSGVATGDAATLRAQRGAVVEGGADSEAAAARLSTSLARARSAASNFVMLAPAFLDPKGRAPLVEADAHVLPRFQANVDPAGGDDGRKTAEVARAITAEDVARFLPAAVTLHAEPDGWAVVGVPANFWTVVRPVVVEGELLGETAEVRFTPQQYRWDYGDGTSRTTRSAGASWSILGQEELTETPTSHAYAARAAVETSVTVAWSAEYRFADSDWLPIAGAVSNSSPEARVLVVRERTVLTDG